MIRTFRLKMLTVDGTKGSVVSSKVFPTRTCPDKNKKSGLACTPF